MSSIILLRACAWFGWHCFQYWVIMYWLVIFYFFFNFYILMYWCKSLIINIAQKSGAEIRNQCHLLVSLITLVTVLNLSKYWRSQWQWKVKPRLLYALNCYSNTVCHIQRQCYVEQNYRQYLHHWRILITTRPTTLWK